MTDDPHAYFPRIVSESDLTPEERRASTRELIRGDYLRESDEFLRKSLTYKEFAAFESAASKPKEILTLPESEALAAKRMTLYARAFARRILNGSKRVRVGDRFR